MIALVNSVNAQVHLCAARHLHGHFFAEKKIRVATQDLDRINRVMVRYGYNGHAEVLEPLINCCWVVVGLSTKAVQPGGVEHSGSNRMNMEVASHPFILRRRYEQSVKRARILRECVHGTA